MMSAYIYLYNCYIKQFLYRGVAVSIEVAFTICLFAVHLLNNTHIMYFAASSFLVQAFTCIQ
jgi:hypothetical protein